MDERELRIVEEVVVARSAEWRRGHVTVGDDECSRTPCEDVDAPASLGERDARRVGLKGRVAGGGRVGARRIVRAARQRHGIDGVLDSAADCARRRRTAVDPAAAGGEYGAGNHECAKLRRHTGLPAVGTRALYLATAARQLLSA